MDDNFLSSLALTPGAEAKGLCMGWRPDLISLHTASDAAIALAYLAIPAAILALIRRRGDIIGDSRRIAILFSAFIILCGLTHIASLLITWFPSYTMEGILKAATAGVSLTAATMTWRMLPELVALPSPAALRDVNARLVAEAAAREAAYAELEAQRETLEQRVAERTRELTEIRQYFEAATRNSAMTVFAQDCDLRYVWVSNEADGAGDMLGKTDTEAFTAETALPLVEVKRRVLDTGHTEAIDIQLPGDPEPRSLKVHLMPREDETGRIVGIVGASIDLTRERRLEQLRSELNQRLTMALQRLNVALRGSDIVVFNQDADFVVSWVNTNQTPFGPMLGRNDRDFFTEPQLSIVLEAKTRVLEEARPQALEIYAGQGDDRVFYDLHVEPELGPQGEVVGLTCAAVNITERKRHEQHQRLIMRELTHRSKNMLAVVQAIARQSAQQSTGIGPFLDSFGQRLRALAGAQDLLVAEDWNGVLLQELIQQQLGHYAPMESGRVAVDGPQLRLSPEATQVLGLALHELATNAAKYGALSNETGRIRVLWSMRSNEAGAPVLEISWTEVDGPEVYEPSRKGFGTTVVHRNVTRSLDAEVHVDFPPSGLNARFVVPAKHVVQNPAQDAA